MTRRDEPAGVAHDPGGRTPVVVLAGRMYPGWSGMDLRWQALRAALGQHAGCGYREITCDRREHCAPACQLTGEPASADSVAWRADGTVSHADRRFCDGYAARLAEEFAADGVSMVVCSGLETSRYVPALAGRAGLTVVYDMHNVERALARDLQQAAPPDSYYATVFSAETVSLVESLERAAVTAADAVWVCSPDDRALVSTLYGDIAPVTVVPNVVGLSGPTRPPSGAARVVYTGRMDYYPNMDAGSRLVYEITPLLRGRGLDVPVVVAGGYAQEMLGGLPPQPGVDLVSSPASTVELITGGIMAVPLAAGGGTRFKILEAFAYGAPVVSTVKGAEGLDAVPGTHYLNAESPAQFVDAIAALLVDAGLRDRLADAAWDLVRARYSVRALAERLRPAVDAALSGRPTRGPS
jgi:glycosyltransferase involved in cell wall biosynthesis